MLRDFGKRSKGRESKEILLANSERKAEYNDLILQAILSYFCFLFLE
jgi:hypothetical protein